jgi:electron transport complex protein RnfA
MNAIVVTLISTIFVNNVVLTQFLGLCPVIGVSRQSSTALGMGLALTFVLTLACICSYWLDHYLLIPFKIEYLRTIAFIVLIACIVQFTELMVAKVSPLLYQVLGLFLPLITSNCAVLGLVLINSRQFNHFIDSAVLGLGTALGFTLILVLLAELRERLASADIPKPFQGQAIGLITIGLMSMAFMGFSGFIKS